MAHQPGPMHKAAPRPTAVPDVAFAAKSPDRPIGGR